MAEQHTFPENGDNDDAENFGQMIGHDILSDVVITGMGFTVNYTTPDVTIGTGVATIRLSSDTAASTGETRLNVTRVVQLPQDTLTLVDGDVNHIYVEPQFGTDDNAIFASYTNTGNAGANALKIGEVDTTADTLTQLNREVDSGVSVSDGGSLVVSDSSDINFSGGIIVSDDGDSTVTIDHEDTSTQSDVSGSGGSSVTGVTLDEYGHVSGLSTTDFDTRFVQQTGDWEVQKNGTDGAGVINFKT